MTRTEKDLWCVVAGTFLALTICSCKTLRDTVPMDWPLTPVETVETEDTPGVETGTVEPAEPEPEPLPEPKEEENDYDGIRVKSTSVCVDGAMHKWVRAEPPPVCKVDGVPMPVLARGSNGTTVWQSKRGAKKITWWRGDVIQWTWPQLVEPVLNDHETTGEMP